MQCMAMLVPIIIYCISTLFLQVCSVVTQFGIVCVGLLLLILYYSRALFCFCTPPHSLLCISAYHTTVSHIKFCFVAYESLHVIVFVFQVSFKLDLVWCWGAQWNFFILVHCCCFAQCLDIHNSAKKNCWYFLLPLFKSLHVLFFVCWVLFESEQYWCHGVVLKFFVYMMHCVVSPVSLMLTTPSIHDGVFRIRRSCCADNWVSYLLFMMYPHHLVHYSNHLLLRAQNCTMLSAALLLKKDVWVLHHTQHILESQGLPTNVVFQFRGDWSVSWDQ